MMVLESDALSYTLYKYRRYTHEKRAYSVRIYASHTHIKANMPMWKCEMWYVKA